MSAAKPRTLPSTAWKKGAPSPNPSGVASPLNLAKRTLAFACQAAASDEQIAEWLLAVFAGQDPFAARGGETEGPRLLPEPVDWTHRMLALRMFLERRDGMPMQAVVMRAEMEMRARVVDDASGAIDVAVLSPEAREALRTGLRLALGEHSPHGERPVIDVPTP